MAANAGELADGLGNFLFGTPGMQAPASQSAAPAMRMPSRDDVMTGIAETIGAPVDGMAWALRRAGLPVNRETAAYGPNDIRSMLDNLQGVELSDVLSAMTRYRGLF